jgi:hypothetical protein
VSHGGWVANKGSVVIKNRSLPAHVPMRFEDHQQLTRQRRNIAHALATPDMADIEFEPEQVTIKPRSVDFS